MGQMLDSAAKCNLTFVTAAATIALMKWTLEFITLVIKPLLTIHSPFTPLHHVLPRARGKTLKLTKIRQVVSFIAA